MRLLVLGGTHFVGRHFVEAALQRGHAVTLFNRGRSDPDAFPEAEHLIGDRDGDYASLAGREWDAVFDPSAFLPRVVEMTCEALPAVGQYVFVSSTAVYAVDTDEVPLTEKSPVVPLLDETSENIHFAGDYGALKAACERVVAQHNPGRALNVRTGFIGGPFDLTDRLTYWPRRIAAGGDVLVPGPPTRLIQVIDVRDLVDWVLSMIELGASGTYNVTGDAIAFDSLLRLCNEVTDGEAQPIWVDEEFLLEHGVQPWTELPLWHLWPAAKRVTVVDNSLARQSGLSVRPLETTLQDVHVWDASRPRPLPRGSVGTRYVVETMLPEREAELLRLWESRAASAT